MSEDEQTDDNSPIGLLKQKVGTIYGAAAMRHIQEAVDICTVDIRKWQRENAELGEELAAANGKREALGNALFRIITAVWPEARDIKREDIDARVADRVVDLRTRCEAAEAALKNDGALAFFFNQRSKWSEETFGPGDRYDRVVKHIRKELKEIEAKPDDLEEWVDVVLLAMDGAWRSAKATGEGFVAKLHEKQQVNLTRKWPDWRTLAPGQVAEHVRADDEARAAPEQPIEDHIDALIEEFEKQHPFTGDDGGSNDRALLFNLISGRFTPRE
jgi:hypothetical protein